MPDYDGYKQCFEKCPDDQLYCNFFDGYAVDIKEWLKDCYNNDDCLISGSAQETLTCINTVAPITDTPFVSYYESD